MPAESLGFILSYPTDKCNMVSDRIVNRENTDSPLYIPDNDGIISKTEGGAVMKLNDKFLRHDMDDSALVVPVAGADFHGVVRGNSTVGAILELLEKDITQEEIVAAMCERYDGDPEFIREDVDKVITQLRSIGAIDD